MSFSVAKIAEAPKRHQAVSPAPRRARTATLYADVMPIPTRRRSTMLLPPPVDKPLVILSGVDADACLVDEVDGDGVAGLENPKLLELFRGL